MDRPAFVRSGADIRAPIAVDGSVVTVPRVAVEHAENQDPDVAMFLANLTRLCGGNTQVLNNISVSTYTIQGNLESINGVKLFLVSDKKTGKLLSYHELDGRSVLELDKVLTDDYIQFHKAMSPENHFDVVMKNGVRQYVLVVNYREPTPMWQNGTHEEWTEAFNQKATLRFFANIR